MADDGSSPQELASREPTVGDLRDLCHELNQRGARYVVIGGFAIRAAGYSRSTMDVDLLVADDRDNEAMYSPRWPPCRTMRRRSCNRANSKSTR